MGPVIEFRDCSARSAYTRTFPGNPRPWSLHLPQNLKDGTLIFNVPLFYTIRDAPCWKRAVAICLALCRREAVANRAVRLASHPAGSRLALADTVLSADALGFETLDLSSLGDGQKC